MSFLDLGENFQRYLKPPPRVQLVKHPMLHASKLQIRASEEFIVRACEISVKKFAGRQHQEIFVGFGGCTSKDNDVSGMSL